MLRHWRSGRLIRSLGRRTKLELMIAETLFAWASTVPSWLATIVLSVLPITESRLTIPVAIVSWHLSPVVAYVLAMIGNALPYPFIFFGFRWAKKMAEAYAPWSVKWFDRLLDHAQKKLGKRFEQYGFWALFVLSSLPLPGAGLWTAALGAVALDLPAKRAAIAVLGGMLVMGLIVLVLTMTGSAIF